MGSNDFFFWGGWGGVGWHSCISLKNYPQEKLEAFQSFKKMVPPQAPTLYTDLPYKLDYSHGLHDSHYSLLVKRKPQPCSSLW